MAKIDIENVRDLANRIERFASHLMDAVDEYDEDPDIDYLAECLYSEINNLQDELEELENYIDNWKE